tara:strand:- start:39 stop:803 length:765 start_codon:yes stop_codon:yes gene_type:complete
MSVFDQTTGQPTDTPVTEQAIETKESYVQRLVEERGEKWQDPETIAKGKVEADQHIKNLETQLAEMREDLKKQDYAKALLEQVQNKAVAPAATKAELPNNDSNGGVAEPDTTVEAPDMESLVEEALKKRDAKNTAAQNVKQVDDALTQTYGTEAAKVVAEKAAELGMGLDRLQAIASESPAAFLRLMGEAPVVNTGTAPKSSVNTTAGNFNGAGGKDWAFFQNLRRTNPTQYYTPSVQRELIAARDKAGDSFFQ